MKYLFTNIIGSFVLDYNLKIIDQGEENQLKNKHKDLQSLPPEKILQTLTLFKDQKYHQQFYQKNLELTKQSLKEAVNEDQLIIQAISNINELDIINNILTKRLREWYSLYYPELSERISSPEKFVEIVLTEKKENNSMGAELEQVHLEEINLLTKEIISLYLLRKKHEAYLQIVMVKYCPNFLELAGTTIGAKLIDLGKSLKHLAMLPASTIQLLGAEKALFRHIKTGSKSPKYGIIINHPIVQDAKRDEKGKAARILADKLSLCARLDFFKGEFKAKEYYEEIKRKLQ